MRRCLRLYSVVLFLVPTVLAACSSGRLVSDILWNRVSANAEVRSFSASQHNHEDVLVHAVLDLSGFDEDVVKLDLNCIQLSVNGITSSAIYVDSMASYNTRSLDVGDAGFSEKVVWQFKGASLDFRAIDYMNIVTTDAYKVCVRGVSKES